jgi:hypothetical protein
MRRALPGLLCAFTLAVTPAALRAQHIALKTVPIPAGEQFLLLPSQNLGMGGLHVAIDDPVGDPFSNPARGSRSRRLRVFALPTLYGETNDMVSGRSLPIAAVIPGRSVFGAVAFALQQVDNQRPRNSGWAPPQVTIDNLIEDNSSTNVYLFGSAGTRLNRGRTAVGASLQYVDLEAIDVVSLLYARSFAIEQSGSLREVRFGLTHDLGGEHMLDAVVANNVLDMSHDVWYFTSTWQPGGPTTRTWSELNEDRTNTWGAQLRYTQPVGENARVGAIVTGNTKSHPKIPNYNLVNIPRDPGNTAAFNIGVGIGKQEGQARVGLELIYEPGRSHTWAYADTATTVPGGVIQPGEKTVDNQFRFNNWSAGFGVEREGTRHGVQLGLRLRQIRYRLDQQNYLTDTRRKTREDWMEWTPTWSYVLKLPEFDVRYSGRFTARGSPDEPNNQGRFFANDFALSSGTDFIIGPTAPVDLPDFRVTTHRLMVSIPFGTARVRADDDASGVGAPPTARSPR